MKSQATVVACLSVLLLQTGCDRTPSDELPIFPQKAAASLVLPSNEHEDRRLVSYWPDGASVRSVQIEYKNGITSNLYFRPRGTLERIEEFYPRVEQAAMRVRKSIVEIADDGVSFSRHEAYRPDGTLARQGERVDEGRYVTYHLDQSGLRQKRLTFDKGKQFLEQEEYFSSGLASRRLTRSSPSTYRHEIFAPDGARVADIEDRKYTGLEGRFFYPDGRVKANLDGHRLGYDIEYFDQESKKRWWVEFLGDSIQVTAFDTAGNEPYKQYWHRAPGDGRTWCNGGIYHLKKVEVLSRDGGRVERTTLEIENASATRIVEYGDRKEVLSDRRNDGDTRLAEVHSISFAILTARPDFECLPVPERMKW